MTTPTGGDVTTADALALRFAASDLATTGAELSSGERPLAEVDLGLREAAGEFAGLVADGSDLFRASWTGVLDVCGQTCGLVANNLGQFVTDLAEVDLAAGPGFTL